MDPEKATKITIKILIIFFTLLILFTLGWYVLEYFIGQIA